jgi:hypothetical protein
MFLQRIFNHFILLGVSVQVFPRRGPVASQINEELALLGEELHTVLLCLQKVCLQKAFIHALPGSTGATVIPVALEKLKFVKIAHAGYDTPSIFACRRRLGELFDNFFIPLLCPL